MLPIPIRRWPLALALTVALAAQAGHHAPPAGRASPLDAHADVPAVVYESAFARYRLHIDEKRRPWKEANDEVGRIGGWRAYAREAAQDDAVTAPDPKAAVTDPPVAPPPRAPGAHHKH